MNIRLRPALLVIVAAFLAACGGAAAPASAPAGSGQPVRLAATQLQGTSFRLALTATTMADAGGAALGSEIAAALQQAGPLSLRGQFQDATHMSGSVTAGKLHVDAVLYGGTVYVSTDGRTYRSAPFAGSLLGELSASQLLDDATHLQGTRDVGQSTQDGVATEEYRSTIDPAYLATLVQRAASAMLGAMGTTAIPAPMVNALVAALHIRQVDLAWYVDRANGHLVRATTNTTVGVDLGTIVGAVMGAAPIPTGSGAASAVTLHQVVDAHFSGWGTHITVTRPASTGSLTLPQLSQVLHAGSATS